MQGLIKNRQSRKRRLMYSAVTIVIAFALGMWVSNREGARNDLIENRVLLMCEALAEGDKIDNQLDWVTAMGVEPAIERLHAVMQTLPEGQMNLVRLEIAPKGLAPFKRGSATHQVLVYVGDQPRLGLFVEAASNSDQIMITGYWDPNN